jgi:hypothetical protein
LRQLGKRSIEFLNLFSPYIRKSGHFNLYPCGTKSIILCYIRTHPISPDVSGRISS